MKTDQVQLPTPLTLFLIFDKFINWFELFLGGDWYSGIG